MFCPKCGTHSAPEARFCISCGFLLSGVLSGAVSPSQYPDGAFGALIPYKNTYALVAYYLGVFSIIPGLGFLLSIPAFALGIMGLKKYKANPEIKGKAHALVGIIAGGLCALLHIGLVISMVAAAL